MRSHAILPDIPTGYVLDDVFEVVIPIARTNLITNPSFELATTNWTAIGGSIARSATYQYHGVYSLAITPSAVATDGARFDTVTLANGTTYAYSAKVRGVVGLKYKLAIETTGGVELASVVFTANGKWQWVYGYYTETATNARRLTVRKSGHASTAIFYLDGVQVEAIASGETVSTYIDGDQLGLVPNQYPPAYLWNGTPHASTSSRSAQTRAGGMVMPLSRYGFLLTAIIGLGLALPQNMAVEYAQSDGGYADYTRKPVRQFTLTGTLQGRSYQQLRDLRGALGAVLDRDLMGLDQRMLLRYHLNDPNGLALSDTAQITAKYAGGMDGQADNHYAQQLALSFTQYLPMVLADAQSGAALSVQTTITNANAIIQRSPAGAWSAMSTGMSGGTSVLALARGQDGTIYAGGNFTDAGGSGADYLAKWDGSAWSVVKSATSIGATVRAIAVGPDGKIYIGGDFVNADGNAAADNIVVYDPSAGTYAALGTGMNGNVRALAFGPDGTLYAGGDFTLAGGVANTVRIAKWDGSAWSALSTGATGAVRAIAVGPDGTVYAGGDFFTIGGVSVSLVASWNGSAWSSMNGGLAGGSLAVYSLAVGYNGTVYAGGDFNVSAAGVSITGIAGWNGVAWRQIGQNLTIGLAGSAAIVQSIGVMNDGTLFIGGQFTYAGTVATPDGIAFYNGSTWLTTGVDLPSTATVSAALVAPDNTLYLGYNTTGSAIVPAVTATVTNAGTARAYPTITIRGPSSGSSRIYEIRNTTTRRSILLNYTINAGETARLHFQPDILTFTSTFQGNIASKIVAGSNEADFFLQPGANSLAFYAAGSTVTATVEWRNGYLSLDDVP